MRWQEDKAFMLAKDADSDHAATIGFFMLQFPPWTWLDADGSRRERGGARSEAVQKIYEVKKEARNDARDKMSGTLYCFTRVIVVAAVAFSIRYYPSGGVGSR